MPGQLTMSTVEHRTKVYDEGPGGPELRDAIDTGRRRTMGIRVNGAGVDAEQAKVLFDGEAEPRWVAEERRAAAGAPRGIGRRLTTRENLATPIPFRDLLIGIARSAQAARRAA